MNWLLKKVTSTALQAFSKDYENTRPIPNSIWSISEKKGKVCMIKFERAIKFHKTFCTIPVFLKLLSAEESDTSASYETEYANPLSSQIGKLSFSEVIWGLYQIMNGLTYLDNRSLLNLSSETIFVTSNGDWKFGVLEFLADEQESISISDSFTQCIPQAQIGYFLPPEMVSDLPRFHIQNISVSKLAAWQIAHLICDIYNVQFTNTALSNTKIPNELRTLLVLLMDQSVHRRPTLNDILKRALFNTDEIKLLSSMDNILLQKDNERIEYMQLLRERLPGLHASIRQGRVLSCLLSVLEAVDCAETLHTLAEVLRKGQPTSLLALRTENVIVKLLTSSSSFISPNKLHQHHSNIGLQQQIGVNQASQDQQVGMGLMLLKDIEPFVAVTSHQTVQKKIFPIILSNMRSDDVNLRNYCVRAVYFLHSKLSSQNIQNEALPRLRERLSDKVPEVRANSTICLCSISSELGSDANNIVFTAISAAIRDQHPTVALAGMESLCKQLPRFPPYILAQRLLPLVPQHLVQPEKKAREAAFNVMKEVIGILQDNSSKLDNEARLENEKRRAEAIAGVEEAKSETTVSINKQNLASSEILNTNNRTLSPPSLMQSNNSYQKQNNYILNSSIGADKSNQIDSSDQLKNKNKGTLILTSKVGQQLQQQEIKSAFQIHNNQYSTNSEQKKDSLANKQLSLQSQNNQSPPSSQMPSSQFYSGINPKQNEDKKEVNKWESDSNDGWDWGDFDVSGSGKFDAQKIQDKIAINSKNIQPSKEKHMNNSQYNKQQVTQNSQTNIKQQQSSQLQNQSSNIQQKELQSSSISPQVVSHNDSGDNMFFNVGPFSLSNRISTSKQGISQLSTSKQNKNDEKKESWEDEEEIEQENWDDDTSLGKVQDSEQEQEDNNNGFPRNIFDPYPQRRNDFGTDPFRSNSPSLMSDNPEMFQMMFKRNSSFL